MIFIEHRRNKISELGSVLLQHGVEMDVRSDVGTPGAIHVTHDPWQRGDGLDVWLEAYKKRQICGPLLLNTKEDGLEDVLFENMQRYQIDNFLFLDTAWPTLVKYVLRGLGSRFMLRISKYEQMLEYELMLGPGKIEWAWVDCFEGIPLEIKVVDQILSKGVRLCLVSPELHGQPLDRIGNFKDLVTRADAICTKSVSSWRTQFPNL